MRALLVVLFLLPMSIVPVAAADETCTPFMIPAPTLCATTDGGAALYLRDTSGEPCWYAGARIVEGLRVIVHTGACQL